ncbi:hypothetical protein [Pseudonocardia zijingensis]|jgi:hypothetical protein|uniref:Uncharacterized protein n=1 Tax=Pseudonocardia zijingensis TaxID=153376 RepID=A0ABN1PEQ4_9PSEU
MTGLPIAPGHLIAAGCFLVLAGLRAAGGSWLWAAVFALAALVQVLFGARFAPRPASPRRVGGDPRRASTWRLLAVSSLVLSAVLLLVQPVLGLVAAVGALLCLRETRLHRTAG